MASLLVGVLLAAVVAACGGGADETGVLATLTATSGDAEVTVEVPEGALPSGVSVSDLSVAPLDGDEPLAAYEHAESLGAYRFEPSGLVFDTPLRLTVELAASPSEVLARLVSSDGMVELLHPVGIAVSTTGETVRATYEIEHFSDLEFLRLEGGADAAIVVLPPPPESSYFVGESFVMRVRVHAGAANWGVVSQRDGRTITEVRRTLLDEPWSADIKWTTNAPASDNFVDALVSSFGRDDAPRRGDTPLEPQQSTTSVTSANTGSAAFSEQTFTCRRAGDFELYASTFVITNGELTVTVDGGAPSVSTFPQKLGMAWTGRLFGTCVGADATVDPTPDPTETVATPDPTEDPTATATPTPPPIAATLAPGFDPCHINPNEDAIGCLPHYDVTSASSSVPTRDRRLIYQGSWEFGAPIPTNPERPIEYWLVLEGNGQRMEFLLEGGPGQPLTCTRTFNGAPSALGPGEACGELIAPNTLRFAGDITALAPGGLVRTFSTLEIGDDGIARGDYLQSGGEEAWELAVPQ